MGILNWTIAAVVAGLAAAALATWVAARPVPRPVEVGPEDADAPMTPLQKLPWWWLGIGLAMAVPFAVAVVVYGAPRYYEDDAIRVPVTMILVAGFLVYAGLLAAGRVRMRRAEVVLDERDRGVLAAAPRAQVTAILVCMAAWTIGLMESFRGTGLIPVAYAPVLFWSVILVAMLALPVGILLGYRRG